jgi:hypothetical protein
MDDMAQTSGELGSAPEPPKEYHPPEVRDYGTLRELTNFSQSEDGLDDTVFQQYATQGYGP